MFADRNICIIRAAPIGTGGRCVSFLRRLDLWREQSCLGVKPRTKQYYSEIHRTLAAVTDECESPSPERITEWAKQLSHYSPSRWNAIVSALQFAAPESSGHLKRRLPRFREFVPPTQAEFERLLQEADKLNRTQAGLIIRFLCLTGLRFCEASRITWSSVRADCIFIPASVAKNGRARCIPLLPGIEPVLERLRSNAGPEDKILDSPHARKAIKTACRNAGLPPLSYHSFRHYFATKAIEFGVDLPTVSRWLGHLDGGSLLARMYFHLATRHSRDMAAKVKILAQLAISTAFAWLPLLD